MMERLIVIIAIMNKTRDGFPINTAVYLIEQFCQFLSFIHLDKHTNCVN